MNKKHRHSWKYLAPHPSGDFNHSIQWCRKCGAIVEVYGTPIYKTLILPSNVIDNEQEITYCKDCQKLKCCCK